MNSIATDVLHFIEKSPTVYHCIQETVDQLTKAGFLPLTQEPIKPGSSYYIIRSDAAVIAFRAPESIDEVRLICTHGDSPCFQLQAHPTSYRDGLCFLHVTPYGGGIYRTFQDIPLGLGGRICYEQDSKLTSKLIQTKEPIAIMAQPPIHLRRDVNQNGSVKPSDLMPILSQQDIDLYDWIEQTFNVDAPILGHDLFIYPLLPTKRLALDPEIFTSPRIDNLGCTGVALYSICQAANNSLNMFAIFHHEEIGSAAYPGADSDFLPTVLRRIFSDYDICYAQEQTILARSTWISADNTHAYHPNYPELYNNAHKLKVNGGPVIKHSANKRYATDGMTAAFFMSLCNKAGVNCQHFENHPNTPGGTTLGPLLTTQISVPTVDVGLAQWSMHSAYETAGCKDLDDLYRVFLTYYQAETTPQD